MSTAAQWQAALAQYRPGRPVRILFGRLGLVAQCRALTAGEVAECAGMGGEAGARYALYLACDALRQAGDALQKQGEILSPFDITQRIPYADTVAAAALIFSLSGAGEADVRLLAEDEEEQQAIAAARALGQDVGASAPTAAVTASGGGSAVTLTPPVPVMPAVPAAALPPAAEVLPDGGEGVTGSAAADAAFGAQAPAATAFSPGLARRALAGDAVWWEEDEGAAGQTRRTTAPTAAPQSGGSPDPDDFARVLADRLRDAAGNM